jgi:cytidyltransferase-like protein
MKNNRTITVGYTYVVGDILHFGHIQYLKNARNFCDKLIVGVLTDQAVLEKKPAPTIAFEDRLRLISELRCVDAVVAQETYSPKLNILTIKPDVIFESSSHKDIAANPYGKVIVMPYYPLQSSTLIKNKIKGGKSTKSIYKKRK